MSSIGIDEASNLTGIICIIGVLEMVTYIHRVFVASLHVIITAVSHSIGTELTITQHEERPVLILQRKVHTDSPRCTVCTTLTEINLVFVIDDTITVLVLILQVTRHNLTTQF